jgi:hypothetical protein
MSGNPSPVYSIFRPNKKGTPALIASIDRAIESTSATTKC